MKKLTAKPALLMDPSETNLSQSRLDVLLMSYEDMEFERRGDWTLAEDYSGTQLFGWKVSSWVELPARTS